MVQEIDSIVTITDKAAEKAVALLKDRGIEDGALRVFVVGGGCSGYQYGMAIAQGREEGDIVIEHGGVTLLVDPMSVQYLMGAEIDYREDLSGAQFIIRNPNATTTCGCGSSFSV